MSDSYRVAVIGGGAVGTATLQQLSAKGCSDCVLLERKALTSGSTWHAAGLLPLFNVSYSVGQIHKASVALYSRLAAEMGESVGLRTVSNIRMALSEARMDEYRYYAGIAETIGVNVEFLTPAQVKELWPLCEVDDLVGAIRHPDDGYVQPADLTQALAKKAREAGATIRLGVKVVSASRTPSGEWRLEIEGDGGRSEVICEHVVSATGSFTRRTGRMFGLDMPVIPVEHQYLVTEAHPEILKRREQGLPEMGVLREPDASYYMREEAGGLLLGPYEHGAPCCYLDGPDDDSEYELFQEDLERLEVHIEQAIRRVPAFGEVGVKKVYNGAIAYAPDGSPMVGPAWDVRNLWINEGHTFGITAAGGSGEQLAEWILNGEPSIDMMGVDPRRFGPHASGMGYLQAKARESYYEMYTVHFPDEERPAGRPLKRAPCYGEMKRRGAVFGQVYGWERPNWFAPDGVKPEDEWSFRRSNYFEHVGAECLNVRDNVGVLDMSAFAKMMVSGEGAESWLNRLLANRVPVKEGRIALCHLLSLNGGVRSEFTVTRLPDGRFYLVSAGAFERHDHDVLRKALPDDGSVRLDAVTERYGVLAVAGPKARDLLAPLAGASLSNEDFPWLTAKFSSLGVAEALLARVNFVGELGWEIHHPIEMQSAIFDALFEEGESHGLKPFGIRAMDSLRMEKSYRLIPRELSIEYAALESGLDRFVKLDKNDFVGRDALVAWRDRGFRNALVTLEVHDVGDADAWGSEAVHDSDGLLIGRVTSGRYGWRLGKSLAMAMVSPKHAEAGNEMFVKILGETRRAVVIGESPYDPNNERLRS